MCGGGQCDEIKHTGTSLNAMGVAIAENPAGYPTIAYQDLSDPQATAALAIARPAVASGRVGNCGPQSGGAYLWRCDFIDGGGSDRQEAGSVSLALNLGGLATIAYHPFSSSPAASLQFEKGARRTPVEIPPPFPYNGPNGSSECRPAPHTRRPGGKDDVTDLQPVGC